MKSAAVGWSEQPIGAAVVAKLGKVFFALVVSTYLIHKVPQCGGTRFKPNGSNLMVELQIDERSLSAFFALPLQSGACPMSNRYPSEAAKNPIKISWVSCNLT